MLISLDTGISSISEREEMPWGDAMWSFQLWLYKKILVHMGLYQKNELRDSLKHEHCEKKSTKTFELPNTGDPRILWFQNSWSSLFPDLMLGTNFGNSPPFRDLKKKSKFYFKIFFFFFFYKFFKKLRCISCYCFLSSFWILTFAS
jgi:hypothetical protein